MKAITPDEYAGLPWQAVESSNIAKVAFVLTESEEVEEGIVEKGTVYVEFLNGGIYCYLKVPVERHGEMVEAESVGGYFNKVIKPNFETLRVEMIV